MTAFTAVLLAASGLAGGASDEPFKLLSIGDPAPPLKVARWVKGEPIEQFAAGKIYVIEFWATWCGPCRVLIPRLTELATQYRGKVTFIGVSIDERKASKDGDTNARVAQFVENMGDRMAYRVAADGDENYMAKNWFRAALEPGIPTTFVVGRDGTIAWIGHPEALPAVLDEIVKGTFDNRNLAASRKKEKEIVLRDRKVHGKIAELLQQGKFQQAVDEVDRAVAEYPDYREKMGMLRFLLLLKLDESKAYAYGRELLAATTDKNQALTLLQIAVVILDPKDSNHLKKPDFDLAIACAKKANELANVPLWRGVLATAYFKKGQTAEAIATLEKAIEQADDLKNFPAEAKKMMQQQLDEFRTALKPPAAPAPAKP